MRSTRRSEASGQQPIPDERGDRRRIVTRHHVNCRFAGVELVESGQFAADLAPILVRDPVDEPGLLLRSLDVGHLPGNIAKQQDLGPVGALDVDHLTARRVSWCLDQDDAGRDRLVTIVG